MNEEMLKQMPEYVQKLPKEIKDFVFDKTWHERTEEVAKKYALTPEQTEALLDATVLVLIGLEKPGDFLKNIIADLNISELLAEQIIEDLESRVFDLALKAVIKNEKAEGTEPAGERIPEIRPVNLPIQSKPPVKGNDLLQRQAEMDKLVSESVGSTPEPKKPSTVPRFTAPPEKKVEDNPLVKKYTVDPYREPLQ